MRELSAELSAVPSPLPLPELWPAGFILSCCHCPWAGRGVGRGGKELVRSGGSCGIPQDVAKEPEPGSAGACGAVGLPAKVSGPGLLEFKGHPLLP